LFLGVAAARDTTLLAERFGSLAFEVECESAVLPFPGTPAATDLDE